MDQLQGQNGFTLTFGVGRGIGCVQHASNGGAAPCLMAKAPEDDDAARRGRVFSVADTPTLIIPRYRLPTELVQRILTAFVLSGERSEDVAREEFSPRD